MAIGEGFDATVARWVEGALANRPRSFESLVRHLPGVDPILVRDMLKSPFISDTALARTLVSDAGRHRQLHLPRHALPVPHPLDFDWRYGSQALSTLESLAIASVPQGGFILAMGAPTFARHMSNCAGQYALHLVDRNPLWRDLGDRVNCHILDIEADAIPDTLRAKANLVVIDPPWYMGTYEHFLWFGRQVLDSRGILAVSVLPLGTRPEATVDRERLNEIASRLGLRLVEERNAVLGYETPPFERNALRAAMISAPLEQWRKGDLWLYQLEDGSQRERPEKVATSSWLEHEIDGVRIRFAPDATSGSMDLRSLLPGDVLPSVSSRHPLRRDAKVWTSGNRIYDCSNAVALYDLCRKSSWTESGGLVSEGHVHSGVHALRKLSEIADIEREEYRSRERSQDARFGLARANNRESPRVINGR